ncbi:MAG TPA: dihydrofolate reductase family protein [Solirubrobacteraceae bacterium]|nr:dihydrofolate reductase family protein [Solirubrobacteraceae bacterium]
MRSVLYASLTVNGYVSHADGESSIAPEVLADFARHVQRAGNVIIGRRTFDLMTATGGGGALTGADVVVLSTTGDIPGAHVANRPEEALNILDARGHTTALIGGGAVTDASFLHAGLVDELYLNLLPFLSSDGPRLALADGQLTETSLIGITTLGTATAQLHYELDRP